jgi:hypothetical protein
MPDTPASPNDWLWLASLRPTPLGVRSPRTLPLAFDKGVGSTPYPSPIVPLIETRRQDTFFAFRRVSRATLMVTVGCRVMRRNGRYCPSSGDGVEQVYPSGKRNAQA